MYARINYKVVFPQAPFFAMCYTVIRYTFYTLRLGKGKNMPFSSKSGLHICNGKV